MRVFDRALAHPPEGATEEDMLTARMKLDEAIPAEVRALQSLSKLGVEMVPYNHKDWHNPSLRVRMAIDKEKKKV